MAKIDDCVLAKITQVHVVVVKYYGLLKLVARPYDPTGVTSDLWTRSEDGYLAPFGWIDHGFCLDTDAFMKAEGIKTVNQGVSGSGIGWINYVLTPEDAARVQEWAKSWEPREDWKPPYHHVPTPRQRLNP